eukprot:TRINITY_DN4215_c0_g1_i1.p1 TRINITY_DN4215_c0_g1~~TRINITY_DN4215_c0_g1_i1.p1  ORF type:complete len:332 (-),score=24.41 TRINITY_DN4215_c0_g1_i1:105-1100(-)
MTSVKVWQAWGLGALTSQAHGQGAQLNVIPGGGSYCLRPRPLSLRGRGISQCFKVKRFLLVNSRAQGVGFHEERRNHNSTSTNAASLQAPNITQTNGSVLSGGALDFKGLPDIRIAEILPAEKEIVLVRHGLSSWNAEGRIQGSSDQSVLSPTGEVQARKSREALSKLKFDRCFASPICRARTSAEIMWHGREEPLEFLDGLREANLLVLEGMRNVDAREQYPELYTAWREDPANFHVDEVYPVRDLWAKAKSTWKAILDGPSERILVVTHKSILRALLCTALGMGPQRFRSMDIHNAGVSSVIVNTEGGAMLKSLNMTAHLHVDGVYYQD